MRDLFMRTGASLAIVASVYFGAHAFHARSHSEDFVTSILSGIRDAGLLLERLTPESPLPDQVRIPLHLPAMPSEAAPGEPHDIAPEKAKTPLFVQFG